jgi:hypothetical protein
MKKTHLIYILIIALISISCSSDDDSDETSTNSINPPEWIQGTWTLELGGMDSGMGFKFTSDDFCSINSSLTSCWKEVVEINQGTTVEEEIDDENYIITINSLNTISNTFHFTKISENEIADVQSFGINNIYIKR